MLVAKSHARQAMRERIILEGAEVTQMASKRVMTAGNEAEYVTISLPRKYLSKAVGKP